MPTVCAGPDNSAKISLTNRLLETNATLQYRYCDGPNILNIFDNCITCLNTVPNAKALEHCKFRTHPMRSIEVLTKENLDVEALKAACVQNPDLGQTAKIDFDLYPTAATRLPSAKIEFSTPTSGPPDPVISDLVAWLKVSFSAVAASESAAAALKVSNDSTVRIGVDVGVEVGFGGVLAILIVVCITLTRRRSARWKKSEEDARTQTLGNETSGRFGAEKGQWSSASGVER